MFCQMSFYQTAVQNIMALHNVSSRVQYQCCSPVSSAREKRIKCGTIVLHHLFNTTNSRERSSSLNKSLTTKTKFPTTSVTNNQITDIFFYNRSQIWFLTRTVLQVKAVILKETDNIFNFTCKAFCLPMNWFNMTPITFKELLQLMSLTVPNDSRLVKKILKRFKTNSCLSPHIYIYIYSERFWTNLWWWRMCFTE